MSKPASNIPMLASVELGSPAADCAHFGICSVTALSPKQWADFQPLHIRHVKALLSVTASGGLRVEFPFPGMRSDTRAQFFPPEGFRVDSARILPDSLIAVLGLMPGMYPMPGVYALKILKTELVVELALSY